MSARKLRALTGVLVLFAVLLASTGSASALPHQLAVGETQTCAIRTTGGLTCWGYLSDLAPATGSFTQVSAGGYNACAVRTDATLACWGYTGFNQHLPPAGTFTQVAVAYSYACALRTTGALACWSRFNTNGVNTVPAGTDFVEVVTGGDNNACARRSDGTAVCWGLATSATATQIPAGAFTQLAMSGGGACGLRADGTDVCWGGVYAPAPGTYAQVTLANNYGCALRTSGAVACWGDQGRYGRANPPAGTTFTEVASGQDQSCALKADASLTCWGYPPGTVIPTAGSYGVTTGTGTPVITARPASSAGASASFSFSSPIAGAAYECREGSSGAFTPCTSPKAYVGLTPGAHTFAVRAIKDAFTTGTATASWAVVDTEAPTITVDRPVDGARYSTTQDVAAAFACADSGPATLASCAADVDGQPVVSGGSLPQIGVGAHTFTVRAADSVGNTQTVARTFVQEPFTALVTDDGPAAYLRLDDAPGSSSMSAFAGLGGEYKNATQSHPFGVSGDGDRARHFSGDGGYGYVNGLAAPRDASTMVAWVRFDVVRDASFLDHGYDNALFVQNGRFAFRHVGVTVTGGDPVVAGA